MPMYEYYCDSCNDTFEELRALDDRDRVAVCPKCKSDGCKRDFSTFAAIDRNSFEKKGYQSRGPI